MEGIGGGRGGRSGGWRVVLLGINWRWGGCVEQGHSEEEALNECTSRDILGPGGFFIPTLIPVLS